MIQIYKPNNTDFDKNGDMTLLPSAASVHAVLNGSWTASIEHQIDQEGRWKFIEKEAVIKMPSFLGKDQLFRIKDTQKQDSGISAEMEPIFYDSMNDCFLSDVRPTDKNGQQALDIMTAPNNKYSGQSNITTISTAYYQYKNLMEAINGDDENSFVSRWGGEILFDDYTVIINDKVGGDYGVEIRYGKNLPVDGIKEEVDTRDVVTRIYPKAYNGYEMSNHGYVDSPLINSYPTVKSRTITFSDVKMRADAQENDEDNGVIICDTQAELDTALTQRCNEQYSSGIDKPKVTISANMVLLKNTEQYKDYQVLEDVSLGDTIHCIDSHLVIETTARVIELDYDAVRKKVSAAKLGDYQFNYFNNVSSSVNRIDSAIRPDGTVVAEQIAGFINGAMAGLRAQYDVAKKQNVMSVLFENLDTESPLYGALGIGTQGIMISKTRTSDEKNWDWTTAINANGIMAGTIVAGLLADKTGTNWWNLDTGEFHAGGNATFAGNLQAAGGTFSGNLQAAGGTFSGDLSAAGGTFSGNLTAQVGGQIGGWKIGQNYIYSDIDVGDYTYRVFIQTYMQKHGTDSWIYSVQRRPKGSDGDFTGLFYIRGDGKIMLSSLSYPQIFGNGGVLQLAATDDGADGIVIEPSNVLRPAGSNDQGSLGIQNHRWKYGYFDRIFGSVASFGNSFTAYTDMALSLVGGSGTVENDFNVFGTFYAASGGIASASDRGKKQDIAELDREKSAEFIYSLIPTEFRYKNGSSGRLHHGFIAQDVKKSMGEDDWGLYCRIHEPEIKTEDDKIIKEAEDTLALRYEELTADIVATLQSINERLKKLEGGS